jgi:hypothetical protein
MACAVAVTDRITYSQYLLSVEEEWHHIVSMWPEIHKQTIINDGSLKLKNLCNFVISLLFYFMVTTQKQLHKSALTEQLKII